jgi:hypothetical protein
MMAPARTASHSVGARPQGRCGCVGAEGERTSNLEVTPLTFLLRLSRLPRGSPSDLRNCPLALGLVAGRVQQNVGPWGNRGGGRA